MMNSGDFVAINQAELVDIRDVHIDTDLPEDRRREDFIRQIGNPNIFKYGKITVKISFLDTESTIEDRLAEYLKNIEAAI